MNPITFADHSSSSWNEIADMVARYPVGSRVTVHYDPSDPGAAMLETRPPLGVFGPLLLGLLATVTGGSRCFAPRWHDPPSARNRPGPSVVRPPKLDILREHAPPLTNEIR